MTKYNNNLIKDDFAPPTAWLNLAAKGNRLLKETGLEHITMPDFPIKFC